MISVSVIPSLNTAAKPFWRDRYFAVVVALGPLCWVLVSVFSERPRPSPELSWWLLCQLVLVYPLLEEIVFRGGLQGLLLSRSELRQRLLGISAANALTSVAFAAAHLYVQPWPQAALLVLPSLIFGWLRDRYGALLPCILLHSFYHAGWLLFVL